MIFFLNIYLLVHPTDLWGMVSVEPTDYMAVILNYFKCIVSRDRNSNFHKINRIFLKIGMFFNWKGKFHNTQLKIRFLH